VVTVSSSTPTVIDETYSDAMEFLLLWWDDLDDLTHACRHLATSALSEVTELSGPVVTGITTAAAWLLVRLQGSSPLNFP